jgi:hypothetical protein
LRFESSGIDPIELATFTATAGVSWDQALDNPGLLPAVQNIIAANWQ